MGALHARVVATSAAATLAWVADPHVGAEVVAERFDVPWLAEPRLDDVDAVIVAAPTAQHVPIALSVLEAGLPLLLEKPLAETYAQAQQVVAAAQQAGTVLMCGFVERFNPAVRTVTDIVRDPMHVMTTRHSPYAPRIATGVAADLLIHDVDMAIRMFGGTPTGVSGRLGFFEPRSLPQSEDVAEATLEFEGGRIASLSASRIAQHKVRTLRVAELGRTIEVDLVRQSITVFRHVEESTFEEEAGYRQQTIMEIPVIRHTGEPLHLQLMHFLALIDGRADVAHERASLLAPHEVIDRLTTGT